MITPFLRRFASRTRKTFGTCSVVLLLTGYATNLLAIDDVLPPLPGVVPAKSGHFVSTVSGKQSSSPERRAVLAQSDFSYENVTLAEDVTWRGTVLVRGYLVIAPQTTLRIEQGTVVRFMPSTIFRHPPRLIVMGRLECNGTAEKPILFAPNFSEAAKGDWGGILLLSSEKRNQCDNIRIEGAEKAIETHFSNFSAKGIAISRSGTGLLLRDSNITLAAVAISECDTGLEAHDCELDLREGVLADNLRGIAAYRSSLALTTVKVKGSAQQGIMAHECRLKFNMCEITQNSVGALIKGGEGQVLLTRFEKNSDAGLHLSGARIKVHRCLFSDNQGDGMRMDDGRGIVWASAFGGNGGYNLANNGREEISAVQNWWGSDNEAVITSKLFDSSKEARSGTVVVFPWLTEKPLVLP